jgi:hypothetical protein
MHGSVTFASHQLTTDALSVQLLSLIHATCISFMPMTLPVPLDPCRVSALKVPPPVTLQRLLAIWCKEDAWKKFEPQRLPSQPRTYKEGSHVRTEANPSTIHASDDAMVMSCLCNK